MNTILVIYTNSKLENTGYTKRYAFNTKANLREGDMIKSSQYDTNMQVVKMLDEAYKYFNRTTGELSNTFTNSNQFEIRELVLREDNTEVIYATKINEEK